MEKKFILKLLSFILIYPFFLIIVLYFANQYGLDRHWAASFDHELTMSYNALLFNSAILQEQVDHSGYFTILFLSIFYKILNLLGFLTTYKFSILNNNNNLEADLQNIVFYTRIYSAACIAFYYTVMIFSAEE